MSEDRARFEAIFTAHYAAVVRYAIRRVGRDGAQEVVAETFLTAWRRLDRVPESALPWLYATARRLAANELRRRDRARRLGERIDPPAPRDDPAERVPQRLLVQTALASLSERDREVLLLTEWERLSSAEAAQVLGCTRAAVKVRLHRARRRFAAALDIDEARASTLVADGGSA